MPVTRSADSWTVAFSHEVRYEVTLIDDYFENGDPSLILGGYPPGRRAVVIDRQVHDLYWNSISRFFARHGIDPVPIVLEVTEATKNTEALFALLGDLKGLHLLRRSEPIIAIGGGILTDIVGLAAYLLARGTLWVRVVTSLQMVDAGTSAKTAVNLDSKSGIGGFWPPLQTIIDRRFLRTLPPIHIAETSAEIVKVALMMNRSLFEELERSGPRLIDEKYQGMTAETDRAARFVLTEAIGGSLEDNADNLIEEILFRRMLCGHTWSGTWEMEALMSGGVLLHGFAVAVDMALTAVLSRFRNLITDDELRRILALLRALGLPTWNRYLTDVDLMRRATESAINARDGELRLPLIDGIGRCAFKSDVTFSEIQRAAQTLAA
jgi:3-dehydroquinate synthase